MTDTATCEDLGGTKHEDIMEEGKLESGRYEASRVCFDGLFAALRELKDRGGGLTISVSHPALVSIVDELSALGVEEMMKNRFYDQLKSLRDFTKIHRDCNVPADHPTLGKWVRLQHKHYVLCKNQLPSPLTKKRFTKLKEIPGFDELFEGPREKKKEDDSVAGKLWAKALLEGGKPSPSTASLALDEKIRLKTAMNNVRLMVKGTAAFSSSRKNLPDKEVVAAQIRMKMAKGTSHRLAMRKSPLVRDSFSFALRERSSSETSDDDPSSRPPMISGRVKTRSEKPGPATKDPLKDRPSITDTFEEKIRRKLAEDGLRRSAPAAANCMDLVTAANAGIATHRGMRDGYLSASAPANLIAGGAKDPAANRYERRLEKMMRKLSAEDKGENKSCQQTKDESLVSPLPANTPGASVALEDAVGRKSEQRRNTTSIDESGEAARKRTGVGEANEIKTRPESSDNRPLSASAPAKLFVRGSTFDDRLLRKLDGECLEDIYGDWRLPVAVVVEDDSGSVDSCDLFEGHQSRTSSADIYGDWRLPVAVVVEDDGGSVDSCDLFEGHQSRTCSASSWVEQLNGPGWDSQDDTVVMAGRQRSAASRGSVASCSDKGASWANLEESCASLRTKYSRWKLKFGRGDYSCRRSQSDCIASVLNEIVYSERWHIIPKENGDVALELTARTPDEHKAVEKNVRELENRYSRSDVYFF